MAFAHKLLQIQLKIGPQIWSSFVFTIRPLSKKIMYVWYIWVFDDFDVTPYK